MMKLVSDQPLSKRLDDDLPTLSPHGDVVVGFAGGAIGTSALRKLLVLVETQPLNLSHDFGREARLVS
jgi:hypothetical protein